MKFQYSSKRAAFIILLLIVTPVCLIGGSWLLLREPLTESQSYGLAFLFAMVTLFATLWVMAAKANAKYTRTLAESYQENARLWRIIHTDMSRDLNPPDIPEFTPSQPRDFS